MTTKLRVATPQDVEACLRLRAAWLDRFHEAHPPEQRWCPAGAPVPRVEDEQTLREHLAHAESSRWAAVHASGGEVAGYVLCATDDAKKELSIEWHTPRVPPGAQLGEAGGKLIEFAVQHAAERGLHRVRASYHAFPDETSRIKQLYHEHGFAGECKSEMLSRNRLAGGI